jgi:hypothetical protein
MPWIGITARVAAFVFALRSLVMLLLSAPSCGRTPLHVASGEPKVRMLCLYGAKVNRLDREGNTALDLALASDRPLVRLLYTACAEVATGPPDFPLAPGGGRAAEVWCSQGRSTEAWNGPSPV